MPERGTHYRAARDAPDDDDTSVGDGFADQAGDGEEGGDYTDGAADAAATDAPDVFLDVPALKVEEIHLEVDDLNAQVSLQANVLDLLKLHVGAEVSLGRVLLDIKGVDAAAQLKVRLDKVAFIIDSVMRTIDDNPQILTDLTRGLGEAVTGIGQGAGGTLQEAGKGAGRAIEEVGEGARSGIESVGGGVREAAGELGEDVGQAVENVAEDGDEIIGGTGLKRGGGDRRREAGRARQRSAERPPSPSRDEPRRVRREDQSDTDDSARREPEARQYRRTRP